MLNSLVSLQQGKVKKIENLTEVGNVEGEDLHIFWTSSGEMGLMIILKVTKNEGLILFSEKHIFGKTTRGQSNLPHPLIPLAFSGLSKQHVLDVNPKTMQQFCCS